MHRRDNSDKQCILIALAIFLIIWTIPSFVWIGYAVNYKNEMVCNQNSINGTIQIQPNEKLADSVGIYPFVSANGVIGVAEALFVFYGIMTMFSDSGSTQCLGWCFIFLSILCCLFRFVWLIVGGVMFWRDCPDLSPEPMNNAMWAMLIMGYLGFWGSSAISGASAKNK